ncbi:unnamed protein product [Prunus brigantina]
MPLPTHPCARTSSIISNSTKIINTTKNQPQILLSFLVIYPSFVFTHPPASASAMILSTTQAAATTTFLLSFLASLWVLLFYNDHITVLLLPVLGALMVLALVVVAARATMMAWITVLVLLTFAGNHRRVLVRRGKLITADVAIYLFRVIMKERGLLAVACATILSLVAMLGFKI